MVSHWLFSNRGFKANQSVGFREIVSYGSSDEPDRYD